MKNILLAVVLALTPTLAIAAPPTDDSPITKEEIAARAIICVDLMNDKLTPEQVMNALGLDTKRKIRDFFLQCHMLRFGFEASENSKGPVT